MSDWLNKLHRSEAPFPRVSISEIISPFARKRSGTHVTRPSNFFTKRSHALGAPVQSSASKRRFRIWGCEFRVPVSAATADALTPCPLPSDGRGGLCEIGEICGYRNLRFLCSLLFKSGILPLRRWYAARTAQRTVLTMGDQP